MLDYAVWTNSGVNTALSTSSDTLVTINPALQVSFTAPASGAVAVTMSAAWTGNTASDAGWWGLLASGSTVAGSVCHPGMIAEGSGSVVTRVVVITGLTPSSTYTWDWAWADDGDEGSRLLVGPGEVGEYWGYAPMTMVVTALP